MGLGTWFCSGHAFRAVLASDDYGVVVIAARKTRKLPWPRDLEGGFNYTLDATGPGGKPTIVEAAYGNNQRR